MADYGIKVSEDGYDAKTAGDINLILKTDFTLLKVKQSGTISVSAGSAEITHSLGYAPQFLVFGKLDSGGFDPNAILPSITYYQGFDIYGINAAVDTTKLYISVDPNFDTAFYFIFYEAA